MSKADRPPVPPAGRNDHERQGKPSDTAVKPGDDRQGEMNLGEQGRQGNIKQNTTNKGYQQDR